MVYGGIKKMAEDEKPIQEVQPEVVEPVSEEPKEEVVEEKPEPEVPKVGEEKPEEGEPLVEEKPVEEAPEKLEAEVPEEPVAEEPVAEPKVEEPGEGKEGEEKESLSQDIKETKEELTVISEVRDEIVALYARNKDIEADREQLKSELAELKTVHTETVEQLGKYIKAEAEIAANKKEERIEQLSQKFKLLGQEKSVEQLSAKDDDTLMEFEKIVDAALDKSGETTPMPSVITPSQAVDSEKLNAPEEISATEKPVAEKLQRKETNDEFFAKMCSTMSKGQGHGKKVQYL